MRLLYFIVSSSVLICLVLLIRNLFRKQIAPGMLYALWLIPLIRLLVPFGFYETPVFGTAAEFFRSPYTVMSEAGTFLERLADGKAGSEVTAISSEQSAENSGTNGAELSSAQSQAVPLENNGTMKTGQAEAKSQESVPQTAVPEMSGHGIWLMMAGIWACGSILLGGYAVLSNRRLKRSIRHMEEVRTDCPIPVCVSEAVVSPCLFGLFRPCILVNSTVMEDPVLCHYVLEHEMTHYRQKDHIWTFLRIVLCVVYWWNPLVWIGASCAGEDAELSCDAKVIRGLSAGDRKAYGYSLLQLLKDAGGRKPGMCVATSMSGGKNGLKRRMEGIASGAKTRKRVLLPVCLLLLAVMLYGCSVPSTKSWMRAELAAPETMESSVDYELSLQDDIKSRLFYYEIYRYGELTERTVISYGKLEGEERSRFRTGLTLVPETEEEMETLEFRLEETGTVISFPIGAASESSKEAWVDMLRGRSVLGGDGEKQEVKAGDDLILMADYYQEAEKDSLSVLSCEALMDQESESAGEALSDTYVTVLIRMVLSDQTEEQLYEQYAQTEYPEKSGDEADVLSISESEQFVIYWAETFVNRDGNGLKNRASEEAWKEMSEGGLVMEEDDGISFGWSSPWPMSPDNNYRILSCDEQSAEILYYAWISDPHMYVWRETLQLAKQEEGWQVTGENLRLLDIITTSEEYFLAYPDGKISGTMMDYTFNGLGEALNQNAQNSRDNAFYSRLFDPEGAACYLLNIAGLSYGVNTDESEWVETSSEQLSEGMFRVEITFLEDNSTAEVTMVQPWGSDGIWIPQTYGTVNASENVVPDGQDNPQSGGLGTVHREGFENAELTYVLPDSMKEQYSDQGWNMERLEGSAQQALRDLYDLTGTKVESCVYMSVNNGTYYFAKTAEDMNQGRVFYARTFQEQENIIPSMDLTNAESAGYSDIRQLSLPSGAEKMSDGELALWFLQNSPVYRGGTVSHTEAAEDGQEGLLRIIMESGDFYEVQIDRNLPAVLRIAGPYPEIFL